MGRVLKFARALEDKVSGKTFICVTHAASVALVAALLQCNLEDIHKATSCNLPDCQKKVGNWTNQGGCLVLNADKSCGPSSGTQKQERTCIDGTSDKCQSNDRKRAIVCDLPDCPGGALIYISLFYDMFDGYTP